MILRVLAIAASLLTALPAAAHDIVKGPNGGQIADAGAYHVELVVQAQSVDVFVTDASDKPLPAAGFKGLAILTVDGKAQRIALTPKENRLSGTSATALPAAPKGVVQLTAPDGKTAQGRFN